MLTVTFYQRRLSQKMSVSLHCAFFFVPFRFSIIGSSLRSHFQRTPHATLSRDIIYCIYRAQAKRMLGCLSQSLHKEDIFVPKVCNIIFYLFFINTHSKLTLPQTTGTSIIRYHIYNTKY